MHIQIGPGIKFRFKLILLGFWIKLTQKGYIGTKKNEHYHRILHIQINLDSKFQLQQTILIFRTDFQKNVYFLSKTEKMTITIEFFVFELVYLRGNF